jgi:hypothetical protein
MNIDNLIEQLINLKSKGAETVYVLDTNWNDYELDHVTTDSTGKRALIFVNIEDEELDLSTDTL